MLVLRQTTRRSTCRAVLAATMALLLASCTQPDRPWGRESEKVLRSQRRQAWAVAPAVNLSGERAVDPILQADLAYQQLQQVKGLTVLPVDRVAHVYASLGVDRAVTAEQAVLVCDLLNCDALVVPIVTIYEPYNPPKMGAGMHVFVKPGSYQRPANVDPRELSRRATPRPADTLPTTPGNVVQVVGMFDAANGTVRDRLEMYAAGRHDPLGPLGVKEYYMSMDRYCGFVYSELIDQLLASPKLSGF